MPRMTKLAAAAVWVVTALALGASTASAQTVELEREDGLGHCPPEVHVVDDRPDDTACSIHAITEPGTTWDIFQHNGVSEIGFSQCQWEFEAAFDENGHGYIYDQVLTEAPACGREPCDEAEPSHRNRPWEAQINESGPPDAGEETLTMTLCLYPHNPTSGEGTPGTSCTVNLHVNRIEHEYEIETGDDDHTSGCINLGNIIEWEGHLVTTPATPEHPGFEIHHLDDEPVA